MQCVIPDQHMKILVKALHSLARIGDDLYIESSEDKLCFRTVNTSQSAYSSVTFNSTFFVSYKSEFNTEEGGKCKLSMKALLSVFKPHSMDRNVLSGFIAIDEDCVKVTFKIQFAQGYTKNYFLAVADNTNVQLKYNKEEMCNKMMILSKTFSNAIKHFRINEEEITLLVESDKASLKNYFCDTDSDNQKVVRTNLKLQTSEFEIYEINLPGPITFKLREIKAVCAFSELSNSSPIGIFFEKAGKPVIFSIYNELQLYEADYVISTLPPEMITGGRPLRRSQLSDVISSVPSTTSGITAGQKKRKLAPVAEEHEPDPLPGPSKRNPAPSPRVSLVNIIRRSEEFRNSPARIEKAAESRPTSSLLDENPIELRLSPEQNENVVVFRQSPAHVENLRESTPIANNTRKTSQHESVCNTTPRPSIVNCVPETPVHHQTLAPTDCTPDEVNFFPEIPYQADELTRSQKNRICYVFQNCFDTPKSPIFSEDDIIMNDSDIFDP